MSPKNKKTVFHDNWLSDPKFHWAQRVERDVYSCYCTLCKKQFSLSNMGKAALTSHITGRKHQQVVSSQTQSHKIDILINVKESGNPSANSNNETKGISSTKKAQENSTAERDGNANIIEFTETPVRKNMLSTKDHFLIKNEVTKAEVIWCLNTVWAHLPISASAKCVDAMKLICCDSEIVKNIKLQRTKIAYVIVHGLGPFFQRELEKDITPSKYFAVAFDESLNKVSDKEQLDLMIRYWSDSQNKVVCRYFTSSFLGHTTASDLLNAIKINLQSFDLQNMIQISMDGPNVNLKLLKDLKMYLSDTEPDRPLLLEIGTCGLHVLHNAFKTGIKSTNWDIITFLRSTYDVFKKSPARKADFTFFTNSTLFPKKFCATRWLNNASTSKRVQEILPNLIKFVAEYQKNKKNTASTSFKTMASGIEDKLIGPKLAFFESIASEVEPFLTAFQSEAPMAPFLYTDLTNLLSILMQKFVKKDILDSQLITKIDVTKNENTIGAKHLDLGYSTRDALRKIKISEKEMLLFKQDCLRCSQNICSKLLEKSPLSHKLTKAITFCDPFLIVKDEKISITRLKTALQILVEQNRLSGTAADQVEREFRAIISKPIAKELMKEFSRKTDRLDEFWTTLLSRCDDIETNRLSHCLKIIFILFHGNASVERGFSVNKECLVENQTANSLIAQRHVWDAIHFANGIENVKIETKMMHAVKNARAKYMESLEEQKKENAAKSAEITNRKRTAEMTEELMEKKRRLIEETTIIEEQIRSIQKTA